MSKIEINVCDHCGKETKDFYANKGWIELTRGYDNTPNTCIVVSMGRRKEGDARCSGYYSGKPLLFCSVACLTEFIHTLIKTAKKEEEVYGTKTG
jgi:hypothetical protein